MSGLSEWRAQRCGGGAESPAGSEGAGAADDEGGSRGAELAQAAELPTAKQGAQTQTPKI